MSLKFSLLRHLKRSLMQENGEVNGLIFVECLNALYGLLNKRFE